MVFVAAIPCFKGVGLRVLFRSTVSKQTQMEVLLLFCSLVPWMVLILSW